MLIHPAFASGQQPYTVYNGALKANIHELILRNVIPVVHVEIIYVEGSQ